MKLFFLVNISAALAHFGLALFYYNLPQRDGFRRASVFLCANLGLMNLFFALMATASNISSAWIHFHLGRHFLFLNAPLFLWMALELSGRISSHTLRRVLGGTFVYAFLAIGLIQFTYFTDSNLLITELRLYSWGYFPVSAGGARLLLGILNGICLAVGLLCLWNPQGLSQSIRVPALLYSLWWAGLFLNIITFVGIPMLPLGNVADALIALSIGIWLHRRKIINASSRALLLSSALSSISFGLLVTWLCLEYLSWSSPEIQSLIGLVTAGAAFGAYHLWFNRARPEAGDANQASVANQVSQTGESGQDSQVRPVHQLSATTGPHEADLLKGLAEMLATNHHLTAQEVRICTMLYQGLARRQIVALLGVSQGTFRNHMSSIYEKTIAQTNDPRTGTGRDKLQRLTVFLHALTKNMT